MGRVRRAFLIVFGIFVVLGVIYGLGIEFFPSAFRLSVSGLTLSGFWGLVAGIALGLMIGALVGLIVALLVALFFYGPPTLRPTRAGVVVRIGTAFGAILGVMFGLGIAAATAPWSVKLQAIAVFLFGFLIAGLVVGLLLGGIVRLIDGKPLQDAPSAS